jgi:hypothetical protein
MTKVEAIEKMRGGAKMTHTHFSPNEWITVVGIMVFTEDGYSISIGDFFKYRSDESWAIGWSEWES